MDPAEKVVDGSFEDNSSAWVFSPGAERVDSFGAFSGTWAARVFSSRVFLGFDPFTGLPLYGPWTDQSVYQDVMVTVGVPTRISTQCRDLVASGFGLFVFEYEDPIGSTPVEIGTTASYLWVQLKKTVVPSSGIIRVRARSTHPSDQASTFLVDLVSIKEVAMAVLLSERAVGQLLAYFQANLASELSAIESERGDSLSLPAPDAWWDEERKTFITRECEVEVWNVGGSFPHFERDISAWIAGTRMPLASETEVKIRITHANRTQLTSRQMGLRSERYVAALIRLLRNNPKLAIDEIQYVRPLRFAVREDDREFADDTRVSVQSVTIDATVKMYESSTGEATASGGVPPSYTVGQV